MMVAFFHNQYLNPLLYCSNFFCIFYSVKNIEIVVVVDFYTRGTSLYTVEVTNESEKGSCYINPS